MADSNNAFTYYRDSSDAVVSPINTGGRLTRLYAYLTLRVATPDDLSRATAKAESIALGMGGYIVTSTFNVPGRGNSVSILVLKVPASSSQAAIGRISALGQITSQRIQQQDLQETVTAESKLIWTIKEQIYEVNRLLLQTGLTSSQRATLEMRRDTLRSNLRYYQSNKASTIRQARMATINLTLKSGPAPKVAPSRPSRIRKAIDRAWNGLAREISWVIVAVAVASPFLLIGALLIALLRSRRRRETRRLLEQS